MKKVLSLYLIFALVCSLLLSGCGAKREEIPADTDGENIIELGELMGEEKGKEGVTPLDFSSEAEMLSSMALACENEKFALYYMSDTMVVAVVEKQSRKIFTSNPFNAANDENYSGTVANRLDSQLVLTYLDEETNLVDMYSSVDCAGLGQYNIKLYEKGIVFDLSIGEEKENSIIPMVISPERYEEIISKLSERSKSRLEAYYTFFEKNDLEKSGIYDKYPNFKAEDVYYSATELSERERSNLSEIFEEAKYSAEDFQQDMKAFNIDSALESYPNFKLSLCYALTNDGIDVFIPNGSIEYKAEYPLMRISLLPYFGAETPGIDANGYLFIPDGSGAIINFNQNVPDRRAVITGKVYGENISELPKTEAVERTEQYYLPVFGTVRNNNSALFGIIAEGDANAEITARLGTPNGNYYAVNPEFIIADYEQYTRISVVETAWSRRTMYLYDKNSSEDNLTVKYHILSGEKANYSAMAKIYSDYLFDEESGKEKAKSTLHLETLGSALVSTSFLGFQYDDEAVLTNYQQNKTILSEMSENGAENVSLLLRGWQKNGLDASISSKLHFSDDLGGKTDFTELLDYCSENKIPISLNNNISFVKYDRAFDNFSLKKNAAKTLELKYAENASLSPDTMKYENASYVVTADSYGKYLNQLIEDAKKLSVGSLSLGDLGNALSADYSSDSPINRFEALKYIKTAFKESGDADLSFDGANAYVLPYSSSVNGISLENSGFSGESACVPFVQMVLGSRVECNSAALNLQENLRKELLKCIESGTTPTFLISYGNTSELKNTEYTEYFAVDYSILKASIIESYEYIDFVKEATEGTSVIEHSIIAENVMCSTYANGVSVYVNYGETDFVFGEITVPASDYAVEGGTV